MWTPEFIASQICVCIAAIAMASTYFFKNRILILVLGIISTFFYAMQFLLLKEYAGVVVNVIGIIRGIWYFLETKYFKKHTKTSFIVIQSLSLVMVILTFGKWYSIFPLIASVMFNYSTWQKNIKVYRWCALPAFTSGVLYSIFCKAYFGIVTESVSLVVAIISLIKLYCEEKKHKKIVSAKETISNES